MWRSVSLYTSQRLKKIWWLASENVVVHLSFVGVMKLTINSVVSTHKRSQAEVFTVYFSLKYPECNNYNVHYALSPLPGVNTPALLYTLH